MHKNLVKDTIKQSIEPQSRLNPTIKIVKIEVSIFSIITKFVPKKE